jgi:hypothetical protein
MVSPTFLALMNQALPLAAARMREIRYVSPKKHTWKDIDIENLAVPTFDPECMVIAEKFFKIGGASKQLALKACKDVVCYYNHVSHVGAPLSPCLRPSMATDPFPPRHATLQPARGTRRAGTPKAMKNPSSMLMSRLDMEKRLAHDNSARRMNEGKRVAARRGNQL